MSSPRLLYLPTFEDPPKLCTPLFTSLLLGCHKEPLRFSLQSCRHRIMCSCTSYFRHRQQSIPKANSCLVLSIKHNGESAKLVIMKNLPSSRPCALSLSFLNITKLLLKYLPVVPGGLLRQRRLKYLRGTSRLECWIGVSRDS